jgi:hypothetical protein
MKLARAVITIVVKAMRITLTLTFAHKNNR